MASYLITGGCGFIGAHLAATLSQLGHAVRILDDLSNGRIETVPPRARLFCGDITDRALLNAAIHGVDGCFHLAAVLPTLHGSEREPAEHQTNLDGALAVFDAATRARSHPVPVVYASSSAVYGDHPNLSLDETSSARPVTRYGADKFACEQHALVAWLRHGVPTCGLRIFDVYGPGQDAHSPYADVIPTAAAAVAQGAAIRIRGSAAQYRDFIHVHDVVRAFLLAMGRVRSGGLVYNVCTGHPTSLAEVAQLVAEAVGVTAEVKFLAPGFREPASAVGDPALARAALAFAARIGLAEGLAKTFPRPAWQLPSGLDRPRVLVGASAC